MILAYDEFVDFIAAGRRPNPSVPDEAAELNQFLQIEHLMRLAKARARQRLHSK